MDGIAFIDAFLHGLSGKTKDQLVTLEIPDKLDQVIALTDNIDRQVQDQERDRGSAPFLQRPKRNSYTKTEISRGTYAVRANKINHGGEAMKKSGGTLFLP